MARSSTYARFSRIDGRHPYARAVPDGCVLYRARRLRGSEVTYLNFDLARECGLIPAEHPDRLTRELRRAVLDAFSLRIVNEHDEASGLRIPRRDLLPHRYMATRYLALQHPGRTGKSSGDGRSVWNGTVTHRGVTWDVTSCGTGVTRLCPATAEEERFFATGNWQTDYGCGTATVEEGMVAALMSEVFHRNGIATERVLAVIELADGFAVNVRAGRNLLRPSHLFLYLKQNDRERLQAAVDYYVDRQVSNGAFPRLPRGRRRYRELAEHAARAFARAAATFESEYVFCWLDWDGDNVLADGAIVDYGSVRQFGLYHREYRFDDGPRWSTTIPEQRRKARHIVQCFAQIRDFLIDGRKPPLRSLDRDPLLARFDAEFARVKAALLLRNLGFEAPTREALLAAESAAVERFQRAHAYFEHARSARGPRRVADGISWNAIFSTRDMLRELPLRLLDGGGPLPSAELLRIALSSYASATDRRPSPHRRRMAGRFQRAYLELVERAAASSGRTVPLVLGDVAQRAAILNRYDRITGDAAVYAAGKLTRQRRSLGPQGLYRVIRQFVEHQTLIPERRQVRDASALRPPDAKRVFDGILALLEQHRHGL